MNFSNRVKFHNNSIYLLLFTISLVLVDFTGLLTIFAFSFRIFQPIMKIPDTEVRFFYIIFGFSWVLTAFWFKIYSRHFHIVQQLRTSFYGLFLQVIINFLVFIIVRGVDFRFIFCQTIYFVCSLIFLPVIRYFVYFLVRRVDRYFGLKKRVAILGNGPLYSKIVDYFKSEFSGCEFIDVIPKQPIGGNSLSTFIQCIETARKNNISEIYSTILPDGDEMHRAIVLMSEKHFIRFKFIPYFDPVLSEQIQIRIEQNLPVVSYNQDPLEDLNNRIIKRLFDLLISTAVIIFILSWLWPILAVLIRLDSKGPVLFKQLRNGRNGRAFLCYKFRTMVPNTEADIIQASPADKRFTKVGKILRKTNLDEFPQFINVLKGEMSVVGPRPHMVSHTVEYSDKLDSYMKRHFIKPGISGWAQVNGYRGNLDFTMMENRLKYDLYYVNNWSPWLDLDITIRTIRLTLFGDVNAY